MAQGWTRHLRPDLDSESAGTRPGKLDPRAVLVMHEVGVDITDQYSKHVDNIAPFTPDLVITVCDSARESCPIWPGKTKTRHVPFADPPHLASNANTEEEALTHYRKVRDEIRAFVESMSTTQ
jgi:arsenate reductase